MGNSDNLSRHCTDFNVLFCCRSSNKICHSLRDKSLKFRAPFQCNGQLKKMRHMSLYVIHVT